LMKIYSYAIRKDNGLAPNPFWDYCTLALDQPLIRQIAQVGDWVVGLSEKSEKLEVHSLLFAMQITEKLTFDEYWKDERFRYKKPDFTIDEEIFKLGDNIYEPTKDGYEQHYSHHSKDFIEDEKEWVKQKEDDLSGKFVLVSDKTSFFYFGQEPAEIPSVELIDILFCDIGHKCIADPIIPRVFLDFIVDLQEQSKMGFNSPPTIWAKDDDSYIQCYED
ncbi:MAG: hypothetical protein ACTSPK_03160, partial [Candidatus Heimdallarchaeota archaeon]